MRRFTLADLILGGLLVFYADLSLRNGHPWASLVPAVCAVLILGRLLRKEMHL